MTDSHRRSTDSTDEKTDGSSRRRVLQGIGAAGVATAIASGSASAAHGGSQQEEARDIASSYDSVPISAQFYSFRAEELSVADQIYEMDEAGYDAFEPMLIDDEEDIVEAMEETGLEMLSCHYGMGDIEDDVEGTAEMFEQFGNPTLIYAYDDQPWGAEDDIIEFAQDINALADELADYNIEFGYHNHNFEFAPPDDADELGYDIFAQEIEDHVSLQLDAGWVHTGGEDPIEYILEYPNKIGTIHMKNMAGNVTTDIGEVSEDDFMEIHEGAVNMRAVAAAARNVANVDALIYEHDQPDDPLESMEIGAEWLRRLNHPYAPGGTCMVPDADTHPARLYQG